MHRLFKLLQLQYKLLFLFNLNDLPLQLHTVATSSSTDEFEFYLLLLLPPLPFVHWILACVWYEEFNALYLSIMFLRLYGNSNTGLEIF